MTQDSASTTLDLPEPLGPTTQVMPGSNRSVVADAKDLKPRRVRLLRCTPLDSTGRLSTGDPNIPAPGTTPYAPGYTAPFIFGFTEESAGHIMR